MAPRAHLVIMARAPRLGTVKRRLARDVGALRAWRFYHHTAGAIARRLSGDPRWRTWLAITPDRWARHSPWPVAAEVIPQGGGDLGARMDRVFAALPPGPVVIVGTDAPDLRAAHVAHAVKSLGDHDWVFGPAEDGGYWLIGARRRPTYRNPFAGVRWSSAHALADTVANLAGAQIAFLQKLADIDTGADLARYRRRTL